MLKNKMLKKILCFSFILMLIFSVYKIGKVWASSDVFEITDASISEKSDTVEASIDSFENNTIKSSVTYHKVNDYVVYKITIKNQGSEDYTIKEIFDDFEDDYLIWEYDKHQNDTFKSGTSKEILLKIIYKKEVSDINQREDSNRGKLSFRFLDEDGKEIDGDIDINPKTGDNILFYVGMGIIALSGLILVLVGKKQKKVKKLALFMILSIPFVVKALSPSLIIEFTNRAKLYDKLVVKVGNEYKVVPYDQKVERPATDPEKVGYTFAGWYVGNTEYDFDSEVTEDIQIEAKFTANTYEVIFDKNSAEATGTMSNVTLTYDEASNLPDNGYSAQGYIFGGWNTKADGTGDSYLNKEEVVNLATTGTVTLYAKWVSDTNMPYRVKHMKQKITLDGYELAETDNETGTTGEEVTPAVKTYSGFKSPETKTVKIKGDGSTEIVYEYDREEYAYTFDSENVTSSKEAGNYAYETSITVTAKEKEGYTFSKWSNDETANPYTFTISGITNLTPEYTENTYEVVFDKNSETAEGTMTNESFNYTEEKALTKNTYTNEGYVFAGWNTVADGSGDSYLDEAEVSKLASSGTITLYAQWMSMNATIEGGSTFRSKIVTLAGSSNGNVKSFQRSYTKPDISTMTNNNIISTSTSLAPVYAWSDNGNIYYWTEAQTPLLSSGYGMFSNLSNITTIDLSTIDTSNVTNMYQMFYDCNSLTTLDLGDNFDTSNVTSMNYMFYGCHDLTSLDLGDKFDTSNVTTMKSMFIGCNKLTSLDLGDKFDTSNVTNMEYMFNNCSSLTSLDLGDNFDTSNVTEMESMFNSCSSLTSLDLGDKFDTSNVTNMYSMFYNCNSLTSLDLGDNFDTSNVANMSSMFSNCSSLTELDISMFDISKVTGMQSMFRNCTNLETIYASTDFYVDTDEVYSVDMFHNDIKLVGGKGTTYFYPYTDGERAHVDEGTSNPGYFTHGLPTKTITFNPAGGTVNVESKSVSTGKKAMSLPVASKEGYDFVGWYTDVINGELFDEDSVVNDDITVYAHWVKGDTIIHKDHNQNYNIDSGDELLVGTEEFYVIEGGSTIKLLPKYNLDENYRQSKKNYVERSFSSDDYWNDMRYSTSSSSSSSSSSSEGRRELFDNYPYWGNRYYIYRDNSNNDTNNYLYDYVNNYKDHLINDKAMTGVTDARLMYYDELTTGYCYNGSTDTRCPYLTQSFWLGSTHDDYNYNDGYVYYMDYDKSEYYTDQYEYESYYYSNGIRPVILVEESSLLEDVTVTFETNGGGTIASQTIKYGKTISWPTNPVKENRKFMGWYTDPEFTNRFYQNTKVTKDTTLYAKFVDWCKTFSTDSWETISSNIEQDPSYYGYGCEKDVSIDMDDNGTPETYKVRIANTSRPAVCDTERYSQTACGVVIEFVNTVTDKRIDAANVGWSESELASWLNTEFYNKIPSDLKSLIIPTYPIKTNIYSPFDIINKDNSNNMIYLLSYGDVTGDGYEGRRLDYYSDEFGDYTRKKKNINNNSKNWWLRSKNDGNPSYSNVYYVNTSGTITSDYNGYTRALGIAPAFRIGTPVYNVTFETNGGTKITKQSIKSGGTATRPASNPTKRNNEFVNWYTDETFETEFDFENTAITDDTVVYAKYVNLCEAFENDNWDTIVSNINNDSNYYPIACEKEVLIDMDDDETPESYTVRLANTSTPEVCSVDGYSQTACGTVIEFVDIVTTKSMNSTSTNAGGWKETEMVTYLNSDFYNKLPSSLQSVIIPTYPIVSGSGSGGVSENITAEDTTKNKIYLLSKREVGSFTDYDNKSNVTRDTRTLDYYVTYNTDNDRIKKNLSGNSVDWWLRSASLRNSSSIHCVSSYGYSYYNYTSASSVMGVAPAFRIGINN